jgi:hypothetical protein
MELLLILELNSPTFEGGLGGCLDGSINRVSGIGEIKSPALFEGRVDS